MTDGRTLVDADAVALGIRRSRAVVYRWGQTGAIGRYGKDAHGRWLYDLQEAVNFSKTRRGDKL